MATILLEHDSASTMKLIIELSKKLGLKMRVLTDSDIEDVKLGYLIEQEKTGKYVSEEEILYKLNKK